MKISNFDLKMATKHPKIGIFEKRYFLKIIFHQFVVNWLDINTTGTSWMYPLSYNRHNVHLSHMSLKVVTWAADNTLMTQVNVTTPGYAAYLR